MGAGCYDDSKGRNQIGRFSVVGMNRRDIRLKSRAKKRGYAMHKTLIRDVNRHSARVDFTTYLDNEVPSEATHVFFIEPASGHLHAYFDCVFPRRSFYFPLLRPFLPLQHFQR